MSDLPGGVNPLDFLHKLSMQRGLPAPVFTQFAEQGPAHMKTFVWQCTFNGLSAEGMGRSKKEAKIAAATLLKQQLDLTALPPVSEKKKRANSQKPEGSHPPATRKKMKKEFGHRQFPRGFMGPPGPLDVNGGPADFMNPHFGGFFADVDMGEMRANFGPPHGFIPQGPPLGGNIFCSRFSKLDRFVIRKHKEVYPTESELTTILTLVKDTEVVMNDVITEMNKAEEPPIKGIARIDDLAKGLLLKTSRKVELLMLSVKPPSYTLVETVNQLLATKIKEKYPDKDYQVSNGGHLISVKITNENESYFCTILFSSVTMRKAKKAEENGSEEKIAEAENPDQLPKEICLKALTALRHTRWFTAMAYGMPSCVECIRIVKDLTQRDHNWGVLSSWAVELLVERALFSARMPLNPAASIMRVMETVASGMFLDGDRGLKDPCEHDTIDVLATLSQQDRENLTTSAQKYLRMMHFRKIYKVLDLLEEEVYPKIEKDEGKNGTS